MTKRSKVGWQAAATANSSACPPLPAEVLGAVVNGGRPNAAAASNSDDATRHGIAAQRRRHLCFGAATIAG